MARHKGAAPLQMSLSYQEFSSWIKKGICINSNCNDHKLTLISSFSSGALLSFVLSHHSETGSDSQLDLHRF